MSYHCNNIEAETVSSILARRKQDADHFANEVLRSAEATAKFQQSPKKQKYLYYLLNGFGSKEFVPACSVPTRMLLCELLATSALNMYRNILQPNRKELYHMIVVFSEDRTGDQKVRIDWVKSKKRIASLMRPVSKDFIGVAEVDVTINEKCIEQGESIGRVLCPHFHILFWTAGPISPNKLSKKLSKGFLPNPDGTKVVKIKRCKATDEDVVRVASYLFKAPQGGKTRWQEKMHDDVGVLTDVKVKRFTSKKAQRPIIFSRVAEILSHTDIRTMMISGGEGVPLKNQIIKILLETTKLLGTHSPEGFGYERTLSFWKEMRFHGWGKKYPTPKIKA